MTDVTNNYIKTIDVGTKYYNHIILLYQKVKSNKEKIIKR